MDINVHIGIHGHYFKLYSNSFDKFLTLTDCLPYKDIQPLYTAITDAINKLDLLKSNYFVIVCDFKKSDIKFATNSKNIHFCVSRSKLHEFIYYSVTTVLQETLLTYNKILLGELKNEY